MKRFILSSAIITAFVALSSCEKHDWEDTKLLHVDKVKHDSHGDAGHGEHAEGHGHDHGDHAEKEEAH
ncbi:MAG: hypothetical protein ACSHX6_09760 [Akkermansiaceae bacterium]